MRGWWSFIVFSYPLTFLHESLSRVVAFLITLISRDTLRPPSFHWRPVEPFLAKKKRTLHTLLEDDTGENSPPSSYCVPVFNEGCTFYQPRGKVNRAISS